MDNLYTKNPDGTYTPVEGDKLASLTHVAQENPYDQMVKWRRAGSSFAQPIYVTVDDLIVVNVASPAAANTVNVSLRYMTPEGRMVPEFYTIPVAAGAFAVAKTIPGAEGFLVSASVETPAAPRGQCFVQIELVRGQGTGDATRGQVLYAGYPGAIGRQGYPQTPIASATDGRGWSQVLVVSNPVAGAEISIAVPANETWIFYTLCATLTCSAAVANRGPILNVSDAGGHFVYRKGNVTSLTAGQSQPFAWFQGGHDSFAGNINEANIPGSTRLPAGSLIATQTIGIQGGDQWSAIAALVERFVAA